MLDAASERPEVPKAGRQPEGHTRPTIEMRRLDFAFDPAAVPTAWYAGEEHPSAFLSALSLLFPEGEKFFVDSVRRYADRIDDPELRAAVDGFVGQEAVHGKEHRAFNALLRDRDYSVAGRAEDELRALLAQAKQDLRAPGRLAVTCALEHFTAILAEQLLRDERTLDRFHPSVRGLWMWHALEETEHKAVAFDVYQTIGGGYARRAGMMAVTTAIFFTQVFRIHFAFLRERRSLGSVRGWLALANLLFGRPGMLRKAFPAYLAYYLPGFHPNDRDARSLVETWKARLFGPTGELSPWLRAGAA
jgi:predicted metal-dependent hydrolase